MNNESEFYVGYLPVPAGLKRSMRRVAIGLALSACGAGTLLVFGQHAFPQSTFEFQQYREFRGVLRTMPYPALSIPGQGPPWLLVAPGKHGAGNLGPEREVRLTGSRILYGQDHMIELKPGSLVTTGTASATAPLVELGEVQLTGEIVDSKCYFGVMNPGNGKVHRDCAVRCISGGIPPALLVRDAEGRLSTILIANWKREWLNQVAEPITLAGRLTRSEGRLILFAE